MAVFDVLPANFFSVLVSVNREIYVEALLLLHQMFQFELNIKVEDYISALISLQEDSDFAPEDDDELPEGSLTLSGKARMILSRFIKTGWVEKEFLEGSFIEIITPQPYAMPVMKLLSELEAGGVQEYNSLVFATYSGLKQAEAEHTDQMYEAVLSAKTNTEQLQYQLHSLYHGIRSYLRAIENQSDVNDLLQNHFEKYKNMSDRIYHPIKTMDSIHRYMVPIQNLLMDVLGNTDAMQTMCDRAMMIKKYEHPQEAQEDIVAAINYVLDAYQSVGGTITEIDRKHSIYTKSSIEKIRYLMTADQTIKGKLARLLKTYGTGDAARQETIGTMMERNIIVNRQEFFDGKSLYHKNVRSRRIDTVPLKESAQDALSDDLMSGMMEQIKSGYPLSRICAYIDTVLAEGNGEISSDELIIQEDSEFIMLLLAVLRAHDSKVTYLIELADGMAERNGYRVPRMIIRKKEPLRHVE
ncbi:MAG: DUF5716 family protein [Clostridia bacterium]